MTAHRRLGRYELISLLGRGGAGEVWEALLHGPRGFRKAVALKVLHEQQADSTLAHEARLGALLAHPNVVGTYELGCADGRWYVAMELVHGPTTAALLRQGPLPPSCVVDIGMQACAGLAHIHGLCVDGAHAGLVHRDIKPQNLLVDRTGIVKIADLGIARFGGKPGVAAGTPGYTAPEQLAGSDGPGSDLFALGATLYVLATGGRPFGRGKHAATDARSVALRLGDPRFLGDLNVRVPGLGPVLERCFQPDVGRRHLGAAALGDDLRAIRAELRDGPALLDLLDGERASDASRSGATPTTGSGAPTILLPRGHLPRVAEPFFGREDERADLLKRVRAGATLITVHGPGGMGKTRLALEAAAAVQREIEGGAWFCDLSEATSVEGVCARVCAVLSVPPTTEDPVVQAGRAISARGRAVVVLDNLEQCVAAARVIVPRWLDLAPHATFLATSRIALRLSGEAVLGLEPLDTDAGVALFCDRAAVRPSPQEHSLVRELVARLDGLPLALELAAARTRMLRLPQLLEQVEQRFRLLSGGPADRPARQRSLRAALDGSWELLTEGQRAALCQLAVFAEGWTLEAAEAVLDLSEHDPDAWALDVLTELADHSLVRFDAESQRFSMFAAVRSYVQRRSEETAAAERRHGAWFAQLGTPAALRALDKHGGMEALQRTGAEIENLRVACQRASARGDTDQAAATALAAWAVLELRGPFGAARAMLEVARAAGPSDRDAELLRALGHAMLREGRDSEARVVLTEAVEAFEQCGDAVPTVHALCKLSYAQAGDGEPERALETAERAVDMARAASDPGALADALATRVNRSLGRRDPEPAAADLARAAELARTAGDLRQEGRAALALSVVYFKLGRLEEGLLSARTALGISRTIGDLSAQSVAHLDMALILYALGHHDSARRHDARALAVAQDIGDRRIEGATHLNVGYRAGELGHFRAARRSTERGEALFVEIGHRPSLAMAVGNLGVLDLYEGRLEDARARLTLALASHREVGNRRSEGFVRGHLGTLARVEGDLAAAEEHLVGSVGLLGELRDHELGSRAASELGRLRIAQGALDAAEAALAEADAWASRCQQPLCAGFAACGRAELAQARGEGGKAELVEARRHMAAAGAVPRSWLGQLVAALSA